MKRTILVALLALGACAESPTTKPPDVVARRPVPRPEKPKLVRRHADGTTEPSSNYVIDQTFNTLNNSFFEHMLDFFPASTDDEGYKFTTPSGPAVIPRGRPIDSYTIFRLDAGSLAVPATPWTSASA
ncbi:MAG: hypothetical protein HYR85_14075 [Planctomycetes bacterium]|nr:hypothetical protein [Planctomycetota bacterium]